MKRSRGLRVAGACLWVAGCVLVGIGLDDVLLAHASQRAAAQIAPQVPQGPETDELPDNTARPDINSGALIGRLEIPALGLSVPVLENDDAATLVKGVGHIPRTAVPGGLGNLVLAGHRDTFFRPLRRVQPGMKSEVVTPRGTFRYTVDRTEIVLPSQVEVMDVGAQPEMTLITCYPFDFIGPAPKRFIVHAHLVSVDPA